MLKKIVNIISMILFWDLATHIYSDKNSFLSLKTLPVNHINIPRARARVWGGGVRYNYGLLSVYHFQCVTILIAFFSHAIMGCDPGVKCSVLLRSRHFRGLIEHSSCSQLLLWHTDRIALAQNVSSSANCKSTFPQRCVTMCDPVLFYRWYTVCDGGPAVKQHCASIIMVTGCPVDKIRWINVGLTLVKRRRRWSNVNSTLNQRLVSTGWAVTGNIR